MKLGMNVNANARFFWIVLAASLWMGGCIHGSAGADPPTGQTPTRYYIAPGGNDAWSGQLAEPNAGHTDGPFATFAHAQDAVRAKIKQGLTQPIEVVADAGTYYLTKPLVFTPADSGTPTAPITWRAAAGQAVILDGGTPLPQWKLNGSQWAASVPQGMSFSLLRIGDHWATRARFPNLDPKQPLTSGWLFAASTGPDSAQTADGKPLNKMTLQFAPGALPHWDDLTGAEVHVFTAAGWANGIVPIDHIDYGANTITFKAPGSNQPIVAGNRFYVENVRAAQDVPGEWFLDSTANQVDYIPESGELRNLPVVAPQLDRLIVLKGDAKAGTFVENLHFQGLQFKDTAYTLAQNYYLAADAAIWMSAARNDVISDCQFQWLGGYAVRFDNQSRDVTVSRCQMQHLGEGGVILIGDNASQATHITITNNTMRYLGLVYKHIAGVNATSSSDDQITHNTISDVSRYGIAVGSTSTSSVSHNCLIAYNDIRRTNLETRDTGAIETLGRDRQDSGNIIRDNLILDTIGFKTDATGQIMTPSYDAWGIYLDDYSSGTVVDSNIAARSSEGGLFIHGGSNNLIKNNIFVDGGFGQVCVEGIQQPMTGNQLVQNILVSPPSHPGLVFSIKLTPGTFDENNHNLYWVKGGGLNSGNSDQKLADQSTLQKSQKIMPEPLAKSGDSPKISDPMFIDPSHDNYALQPNSPALALGFQPIPVDKIGVEPASTSSLMNKSKTASRLSRRARLKRWLHNLESLR